MSDKEKLDLAVEMVFRALMKSGKDASVILSALQKANKKLEERVEAQKASIKEEEQMLQIAA